MGHPNGGERLGPGVRLAGEGVSSSGFRVRAEQRDSAINWLKANQMALGLLPMASMMSSLGRGSAELDLGSVEIGGNLLSAISSGLRVDPGRENYSLYTSFLPPTPNAVRLSGAPFEPPYPLDDYAFVDILQSDPALRGKYTVTRDELSDKLFIGYDQQQNGGEVPHFVFEAGASQFGGIGYNLRITQDGLTDESIAQFGRHYPALAELTERICVALYGTRYADSPDRTFVMRPPMSTDMMVTKMNEVTEALKAGFEQNVVRRPLASSNPSLGDTVTNTGQYL
jgi:hypothetical protein